MIPCPHCSAKGKIDIKSKATNMEWVSVKCPECKGTGKKAEKVKK